MSGLAGTLPVTVASVLYRVEIATVIYWVVPLSTVPAPTVRMRHGIIRIAIMARVVRTVSTLPFLQLTMGRPTVLAQRCAFALPLFSLRQVVQMFLRRPWLVIARLRRPMVRLRTPPSLC